MASEHTRRSSPTNTDRRNGSIRRGLRLFGVLLLAAVQFGAFFGSVQAARFDEKVKAPPPPSNAELKAVIRDYFDTYARVNAKSPAGIVKDQSAHSKWFDTKWRLGAAMETWKAPVDLAEYGVTPKGDGSYSIDVVNFPQWDPLDARLTELLDPNLFESHSVELKQRGFRDSDVAAMKAYIATMDRPERLASAANIPLVESFAAQVNSYTLSKHKMDKSQVQAFVYQGTRNSSEATRQWALGLLAVLDRQRQRILDSYFMERQGVMAMRPSDPESSDHELEPFVSGDYLRLLEAEKEKMEVRP